MLKTKHEFYLRNRLHTTNPLCLGPAGDNILSDKAVLYTQSASPIMQYSIAI